MCLLKRRFLRASAAMLCVVQNVEVTGITADSGELILVVKPDAGPVVEVFAGIHGGAHPAPNGTEQGVFAADVNIAPVAMAADSCHAPTCRWTRYVSTV